MALPKLNSLVHSTTLPLSKQKVTFRPYNLGDEKLLIAAAASQEKDPEFFIDNTMKVLRNCTGSDVVEKLPAVDVQYLLMQLRAVSAGETADVKITLKKDQKPIETTIDLTKFYVNERNSKDYVIKLTDEVGLKMRETTFAEKARHAMKYKQGGTANTDIIYEMIADSVESIYEGDQVYVIGTDATRQELMEFLEQVTNTGDLYRFINNTPALRIKVNVEGKEIEVDSNKVNFTK